MNILKWIVLNGTFYCFMLGTHSYCKIKIPARNIPRNIIRDRLLSMTGVRTEEKLARYL